MAIDPTTPESNETEQQENGQPQGKSRAGLAGRINSIITGATGAVRSRHSHSTSYSETGTNPHYEDSDARGGNDPGIGDAT